jgi:hypothetical protein
MDEVAYLRREGRTVVCLCLLTGRTFTIDLGAA